MNPLLLLLGLAAIFGFAASKKKDGPVLDNPADADPMRPIVAPGGTELTAQLDRGFERVVAKFGLDVARNVERIYRNETANFKSLQFRRTNTPGMHAFRQVFPFGWDLPGAGITPADTAPTITMDENAGGSFSWVVFRELGDAIYFVGYFLDKWGNNVGRWHSTEEAQQKVYADRLAGIATPIVDRIASR